MQTTGRQSTPIYALQAEVISATSARATRVSHCQTHRLNFPVVLPTVPLCSATVTCVISDQTLFAMCTAPYLLGTTTKDPCIEKRGIDRQAQCGFYTRPQRKTGYRDQTSPLMVF